MHTTDGRERRKKAQKNVGRFRILKPVWRNNGPFLLHSIEHLSDDGEKEVSPAQREANELEWFLHTFVMGQASRQLSGDADAADIMEIFVITKLGTGSEPTNN